MSDLRVNIRILYYHFKITNDWKFSVYDFKLFKKD